MDWSRAKNILLIILILLNIFLFINVLNVKDPFDITGKYQRDAKKALQESGVIISGNIPTYTPVGRISYSENEPAVLMEMVRNLTGMQEEIQAWSADSAFQQDGKKVSFQDGSFIYTEENSKASFPSDKPNRLDRLLKGWISGISKDSFVQDTLVQDGNRVIAEYVRQYKGLPIFSQRIRFTIEDDRLVRVEGSMKIFEAIKVSKTAEEIISPNIVLLTGKDKVQGIVTSIKLGYSCLQQGDLYDTPVWRITLSSGETVWFNAYTGEYLESTSGTT